MECIVGGIIRYEAYPGSKLPEMLSGIKIKRIAL